MSLIRPFSTCLLIVAVTVTLPGVALAKKAKEKKPAKTPYEEVLEESGLMRELNEIPRTLFMSMKFAGARLGEQGFSEAQLKELNKRINSAYEQKKSRQQALQHLKQNLRARDISKILAWLRSPSGKMIHKAELAAADDEAILKMQAYFDSLQQTPPPRHYLDAIDAIMKAQAAMSLTTRISAEGELLGEAAIQSVRQSFDQETFANRVREQIIRSSIPDEQMRAETQQFFLFTYRDVPEQDLHRYVAFLQSEAGRRLSYAVISTYLDILEDGRDTLAAQMYGQEAMQASQTEHQSPFPATDRASGATAKTP